MFIFFQIIAVGLGLVCYVAGSNIEGSIFIAASLIIGAMSGIKP